MELNPSTRRIVLDTTSLVCPYPYLRAKEALEKLGPDEELELITDNEATIRSSVPQLSKQFGVQTDLIADSGRWRVRFRRN